MPLAAVCFWRPSSLFCSTATSPLPLSKSKHKTGTCPAVSTRSSCEVRERERDEGRDKERRPIRSMPQYRAMSAANKKNSKPSTSSTCKTKGYFSQFGAVTRVRLSRVKKTGKPKSYAFLEFANPAVAEIAADAMDGYLMFSQRLSVKVLAPEAVHPTLFKGANRTFTKVPWKQLEAKRVNKKLTAEEAARRRSRAAKADAKRAERIEKSGIDYQYERLLESILNDEEEPAEKKEGKKKIAATASKGTKAKAAAEEAAAEQQQQQPAKKKAKKTAAASSAAPAAAKTKKPAAKEAAAAPAAAGAKKTKRGPVTAAATATLSSKRARG